MKTPDRLTAALMALLFSGCYGSTTTIGTPDGATDAPPDTATDGAPPPGCTTLWDCNPGVPCGAMVPCVEGECRPDIEPIWIECPGYPCASDADCIVADPFDCCTGCPMVVHREELSEHRCYFERDRRPSIAPEECFVLCYACPSCYPQPLSAVCRSGMCVVGDEGCPYTGDEEVMETTVAAISADPVEFSGRTVRVSGSVLAIFSDCMMECLPPEPCCMADLHLGGVVRLEGRPCETDLMCWGDESCPDEWNCLAFADGAFYEVVGEVRSTHWRPSMWVEGIREVDPYGIGGAYDVVVDSVTAWPEDPGTDCAPVLGGESGRLVVADSGATVVVTANFLRPAWCTTFSGTSTGTSFQAWIDMDCGWCDYWIRADAEDGDIRGTYHAFDGTCHTEATFSGSRI